MKRPDNKSLAAMLFNVIDNEKADWLYGYMGLLVRSSYISLKAD